MAFQTVDAKEIMANVLLDNVTSLILKRLWEKRSVLRRGSCFMHSDHRDWNIRKRTEIRNGERTAARAE